MENKNIQEIKYKKQEQYNHNIKYEDTSIYLNKINCQHCLQEKVHLCQQDEIIDDNGCKQEFYKENGLYSMVKRSYLKDIHVQNPIIVKKFLSTTQPRPVPQQLV